MSATLNTPVSPTLSTASLALGPGTASSGDARLSILAEHVPSNYRGNLMTGLFAENFWGEKDVFVGFETLSKHLRKGRKETVEVSAYLKERISIEEDYAKRLAKLAKVPFDNEGFGSPKLSEDQTESTLRNAFAQIKEGTDQLATRHRLLAEDLSKLVHKPLENFKENQKRIVTEATNAVAAAQKEFAAHRANVPKLQKIYVSKCQEIEAVKDEIEAAGGIASKDKRVEKLQQKLAKLQKEMEAADATYMQSIPKLEMARLNWEEEVTQACHVFEGAETERINTLKDRLTEFVLVFDRLHQASKALIDQQRTYMECIKSDVDIEEFVTFSRTGATHPGPTIYENFYTGLLKDVIFGISLASHLETTNRSVPLIMEKCMAMIEKKGLKEEGVYRLSGRLAKVRALRGQFDKKDSSNIDLESDPDIHVNDVASLMKLYLRELPEPLITFTLYDEMIAAVHSGNDEARTTKLRPLIQKLPQGNKCTLQALLQHLRKVAAEEQSNKMGVPNLAIVFGPCLVRSQDEANALKDFRMQSKLVEDLLNHYEFLFAEE